MDSQFSQKIIITIIWFTPDIYAHIRKPTEMIPNYNHNLLLKQTESRLTNSYKKKLGFWRATKIYGD